jgi:hypothetical protein
MKSKVTKKLLAELIEPTKPQLLNYKIGAFRHFDLTAHDRES